MFFSLLYTILCYYSSVTGCKISDFFEINKDRSEFYAFLFAFFTDLHYFCTRIQEETLNIIEIIIKYKRRKV